MSHPDMMPELWTPLSRYQMEPGSYEYMPCHWTDVERGKVIPQHAGQIFYFADLYGMWVYTPPEPKADRNAMGKVLTAATWVVCLTLLFADLYLVWVLAQRVEWFR